MSMRVLIKDHPHRTLALVTDEVALIFRHSHNTDNSILDSNATPRCMVEFVTSDALDFVGYRSAGAAQGTLGLITLNNDVFLCTVTSSVQVAHPRPGESIQKIQAVDFYCLNRPDYDHHNYHGPDANPYPGQSFTTEDVDYGGGYDQGESTMEHPFHALKKLLNGGNFYYSADFDLTTRLQERSDSPS